MTKTEKAVTWAIEIANDPAHGYDQDNRWGPDYDCSSPFPRLKFCNFLKFENAYLPIEVIPSSTIT